MIQPSPEVFVNVSTSAVHPLFPSSTPSLQTVSSPLVSEKSSANQPRSWNAASVA